jgi:hypothetical protein
MNENFGNRKRATIRAHGALTPLAVCAAVLILTACSASSSGATNNHLRHERIE